MEIPYDYKNFKELNNPILLLEVQDRYEPYLSKFISLRTSEEKKEWLLGWDKKLNKASLEDLLILFSATSPVMAKKEKDLRTDSLRNGILWDSHSLHYQFNNQLPWVAQVIDEKSYRKQLEIKIIHKLIEIISSGLYLQNEFSQEGGELHYQFYYIQLVPRTICDLMMRLKELDLNYDAVLEIQNQLNKFVSKPPEDLSMGMKWWFTIYAKGLLEAAFSTSAIQQKEVKRFIKKSLIATPQNLLWRDLINIAYSALALEADETDSWYLDIIFSYLVEAHQSIRQGLGKILLVDPWNFSFADIDTLLATRPTLTKQQSLRFINIKDNFDIKGIHRKHLS